MCSVAKDPTVLLWLWKISAVMLTCIKPDARKWQLKYKSCSCFFIAVGRSLYCHPFDIFLLQIITCMLYDITLNWTNYVQKRWKNLECWIVFFLRIYFYWICRTIVQSVDCFVFYCVVPLGFMLFKFISLCKCQCEFTFLADLFFYKLCEVLNLTV